MSTTSNPFDFQERGILTSLLFAPPKETRIRRKGKTTLLVHMQWNYNEGKQEVFYHLTKEGWLVYKNEIRKAFLKNKRAGVCPAANMSFADFSNRLYESLSPSSEHEGSMNLYPESYGLKFPVLILVCETFDRYPVPLKGKWIKLQHQTAGLMCHQHAFHARVLTLNDAGRKLADELAVKYDDSCISSPPTLSTAVEYEGILSKHGVSCNTVPFKLEEALYPIDTDCVQKLTKTRLPKDLKNLIVQKPIPKNAPISERMLKLWTRFSLYILTENSD